MYVRGANQLARSNIVYEIHRERYNYPIHIHHNPELLLVLDGEITVTANGISETARSG